MRAHLLNLIFECCLVRLENAVVADFLGLRTTLRASGMELHETPPPSHPVIGDQANI